MSALISPADLQSVLAEVTVLDVRWQLGRDDGADRYLTGHVPGAAYVDLETDLADPPGARGRHPLPDPDRFAAAMRRCGVRRDRPVVVYDDWSSLAAARAWWLLRHHRHPDVRLLDGGLSAWTASGGEVRAGEQTAVPGDLTADPGGMPVVDADGAARVAREGGLVDARAPERFSGLVEPVYPVAGHIPGALNVPAVGNLVDGRFRSPTELARTYTAVLEAPEIAAYCGSGITASHDVLALDLLGRTAALYPGSWSEWVHEPGARAVVN